MADFKAEAVSETQRAGCKVIRYKHEMIKEWGYGPDAVKRPFIVVEPARTTASPPMLVYLHSGGNEFGPSIPTHLTGFGPEFLTLALHSADGADRWHGWHWAAKEVKQWRTVYAPPEHRLLATIEWVARKYRVDRNRIYLWGVSMGGSGTLGLGMARGDIFAALWVVVPAGVDHAWHRMGFPERKPLRPPQAFGPTLELTRPPDYLARFSGVGLPDCPPIVNFSSQTDSWARNQENLLQAVHDGRHLMVFCWTPNGHGTKPESANPVICKFPWLSIRKDQAYPVFINASTDQRYPGLRCKEPDQEGQINGYFRWKNGADQPARFEMELWLADAGGVANGERPVSIPEKSIVDVTPRRLQGFKVQPDKTYAWHLTEGAKVVQSGKARPDAVGLLTIPRLTIRAVPRMLVLELE